jgi:hypothetical protein
MISEFGRGGMGPSTAPILLDNARREQAEKHGGGLRRIPLDETHRMGESPEHRPLLAVQRTQRRRQAGPFCHRLKNKFSFA